MPKVKGVPTVRFILHSTKEPKVPTYIFLYFHYKGKRLKYSTGEKVCPEVWDAKERKAKASTKYPENVDVNTRLGDLRKYTIEIYRETNGEIDPADFRKELDYRMEYAVRPENEKPPTLLKFIETSLEERAKQPNAKASTLTAVSRIQKHLLTYAEEKGKALAFDEINQAFFHDFKAWLFAPPRSLQTNYVHKLFSMVRMFMRDAKRRGYHSSEAFEAFKIGKEKTTKIVLSFEELEHLYALDLSDNPRLEKVRDLFLIGAYSGLRFSDFSRLRPEHITTAEGERMIEITTQKTGEKVYIPLYHILEDLLKKYDFSVPKISGQKMNDYLKDLGKMAGFTNRILVSKTAGGSRQEVEVEKWEKLTTHVARRSFATNFYQSKEMPMYKIMLITGHKTEHAFREYISIDAKMAALDFAKDAARIAKQPPRLKVVN